ncbi:MAG TPA: F0F1 ATP synthase subunit alpha [Actinomycetota bacterium]|nr:F0F1 ATP synthase subunit alpha [Actinomycetota bacterium]
MAQAEFQINPDEISSALRKHISEFTPRLAKEEVGRVEEVGDGIARVSGLPTAMANEMLEFPGGVTGLAMNLEEDSIGAIILGEADRIEEGDPVKQTGRVLSVGVGDEFLGRVVDALGRPLDGKGPIKATDHRQLEVQAPGVTARQPVKNPLQTGIKAIDAMTAIGRGQRQLIIGDRQTGKTAIAIDAIINQRENWGTDNAVKCIYVAVGQKASTVAEVMGSLEEAGALQYTVIVNAAASDPAPFQYLAPYSGCAMGQHWMENGEDALIVYDDLSKQAIAYRQLSLLLRRPPGREAYPGDVFYLHSRLLERAAKLSDENGGGSLTALPIIETKGGDVSAYIPTNVISITDGQIFLETDLFFSGVRPAINVGISVSRVGGNAQIKAMKQVAGRLRLDLAQFRELEAFAEFGSELDKASQAQLDRGGRVVELLKQRQYNPFSVEDQVISIWAVSNGYLDDLPIDKARDFEAGLLDHMHSRHSDVGDQIKDKGTLPEELQDKLRKAVEEFKSSYADKVDTVETTAAEEGVPEASGTPAAEGDTEGDTEDEEANEETDQEKDPKDSKDSEE